MYTKNTLLVISWAEAKLLIIQSNLGTDKFLCQHPKKKYIYIYMGAPAQVFIIHFFDTGKKL